MGVNSLWDIIGPTARPVRLEALSRKKLAVDASIWIYQFLKAVRDEEGNAMQNSHIVGFFRRICKLLYFGILPIFVFDGGAPALKRQTINNRKERRQGNSESTRQIAQKLLAIQVQRQAERLRSAPTNTGRSDDYDDDEVIYLEDQKKDHDKRFIRKDEYHLPAINKFKVSTDDTRIMPDSDFQETIANLDYVDGIDINSVDPASEEFKLLPMSTQYMILSHLRIKSRLRMGYNKEQLEALFPNSMEFSKFQIQQVQKRNFFTQKLMNIAGFDDDGQSSKRIAGDKDRKYALMRNDDGWTLSLQESSNDNPIIVDDEERPSKTQILTLDDGEYGKREEIKVSKESKMPVSVSDNSDSDFEDIPLEPTEPTETQEEKNYQKALIESIYQQYEEKKPNNLPLQKRFDDKDLLKVIESKEKSIVDGHKKPLQVDKDSPFQRQFDDKELLLVIESKAQTQDHSKENIPLQLDDKELQQAIEESKADLVQLRKEEDDKLDHDDFQLELGNSFLFSKPRESMTEDRNNVEEKRNEVIEEEKNEQQGQSESDVQSEDVNDIVLEDHSNEVNEDLSNEVNEDLSNVVNEDLSNDVVNVEEPITHNTRAMPSWFNEASISNPHKDPFVNNKIESKVYKDDEEAGLISWNEAKDMIGEENVSDSSDDIQEISEPIQRTEVKEVREEQRKAEILDYDFEQEDEDGLVQQLMEEEVDHENFKSTLRGNLDIQLNSINLSITEEQLLQEKLQKAKRDSDEVTQNMIVEVQELLKRFGIPYITAPMEAEAQCAELLKLNLVDGIITDDSDCFLFGGDRVYKNMFNQKQYVECYISDEINAKLGIDQDKLIELALLLGSDYTDGIKGIGPVLAMEILAEFGTLKKFKKWFDENTKTQPKKGDTTSLQKSLLTRIKNGKLFLSDSFPDQVVFDAYKAPEVDHDKSEFKWGIPSLDQIRSFLMYNVGWSQSRVDEVMIPLIRDMNRKKAEGTQSTIGEFFPQEYIQSRKDISVGKRMKSAANKLNKRQKT